MVLIFLSLDAVCSNSFEAYLHISGRKCYLMTMFKKSTLMSSIVKEIKLWYNSELLVP